MEKILLISNMYPSKKYKHYGVFVQNTASILKNNGYQVDVSALKKKDSKLGKLGGYLSFYLKSIFLCLFHHYDYLYAHYISHCALLIKIIKKLKPSIKVIVNVHGNDVVPEDAHDEKFIPLVKSTLPLIDLCIVPSSYYQKVMMEQYGLNEDKIKIFPSGGINFDVFQEIENAKEKLHLDPNKKCIGYIGRYEKRKGWEVFLKAISLLENVEQYQIVMVGVGEDEEKANALIQEYHLENVIKKYPMQTQKELALFYSAIDIFCFPTYRKSDSLGLVGLEAILSCTFYSRFFRQTQFCSFTFQPLYNIGWFLPGKKIINRGTKCINIRPWTFIVRNPLSCTPILFRCRIVDFQKCRTQDRS